MHKEDHFTLQDVEKALILKSWWAALVILPVAKRLILFLANRTNVSPNTLTTVSIVLKIVAAACFAGWKYHFIVAGAILFQLGYLVDCIDGPIARLKGQTSVFGRYFDHLSDVACGCIVLAALGFGQGVLFTPVLVGMIVIYISEYYITYVVNIAIANRKEEQSVVPAFFGKYRKFFFDRNFKSFLSLPDFEAATLFIFPILGFPVLGLKVGFFLLVIVTLYKILSSFVTLRFGGTRFP